MLKLGDPAPLVLLASNTDWSIANFRGGLISRLQAEGYRVAAVAPDSGQGMRLPCESIPVEVDRRAVSPLRDFRLLRHLAGVYRARRPFAVLTFTPKLNVYGVLAARHLAAKVISNVSGLGSGFLGGGLMMRIMHALAYFRERGLVDSRKSSRCPRGP